MLAGQQVWTQMSTLASGLGVRIWRMILGVILGSFIYLVVSCFYWFDLDVPKIDRTQFKLTHGDKQ